ncbi:MAG: hypothetical protein IJB13_03055 [Clostridia bacterium]|nr:hypothetical protein [Clostridia bacterium]MBQ6882937.1 hypothetical protein [Clostridia bacterium]
MTFLTILVVGLALIGFVYLFATERNNIILNAIMTVVSVILPTLILSIILVAPAGADGVFAQMIHNLVDSLPWWAYLIGIVVDAFCIFCLIFVSGEKLEDVFDDHGNKIGQKGGSMGLCLVAWVLTFILFFALCSLFV